MPEANIFQEVRARVTALEAARHYGYHPNRSGFIPCPFHREKTASLKLYDGERGFYCYGCHVGGSVIDFVGKLFGLRPLDAAKKLNADFNLGLTEGNRRPFPAEEREGNPQQKTAAVYERLQWWRNTRIHRFNVGVREAELALKSLETPSDLDKLTAYQATAIRLKEFADYYADALSDAGIDEQMEPLTQKGGDIEWIYGQLSNNLPPTPTRLNRR